MPSEFFANLIQQQKIINHRYRVMRFLGQGGMSSTYEARLKTNDSVAIKIVYLRKSQNWKIIELLKRGRW